MTIIRCFYLNTYINMIVKMVHSIAYKIITRYSRSLVSQFGVTDRRTVGQYATKLTKYYYPSQAIQTCIPITLMLINWSCAFCIQLLIPHLIFA